MNFFKKNLFALAALVSFAVPALNAAVTNLSGDVVAQARAIIASNKYVVIDIYASWCPPCKRMHPIMDWIATQRNDVVIVKVDGDQNPAISSVVPFTSFPTFAFFKDGMMVKNFAGSRTDAGMLAEINSLFPR
jgi:thioredoxin 1